MQPCGKKPDLEDPYRLTLLIQYHHFPPTGRDRGHAVLHEYTTLMSIGEIDLWKGQEVRIPIAKTDLRTTGGATQRLPRHNQETSDITGSTRGIEHREIEAEAQHSESMIGTMATGVDRALARHMEAQK